MNELIPNIEDLRSHLPTDHTSTYAHEFVSELATGTSVEDVNEKVDALVDRWLGMFDDHGA